MRPDCQTYRLSWFDSSNPDPALGKAEADRSGSAPAPGDLHPRDCEDCRNWSERSRQVAGILRAATRHPAPAELDLLVAAQLATSPESPTSSGIEQAPVGVAGGKASSGGSISPLEGVLRTLERKPAPAVLERLVMEELANPEKANVARQVRRLSRRRAPHALSAWMDRGARYAGVAGLARWARSDRQDSNRLRRAAAVALVGLAATAAAWFGFSGPPIGPGGPGTGAAPGLANNTSPRLPRPEHVGSLQELAAPAGALIAAFAPELVYGSAVSEDSTAAAPRREPRLPATAPLEAPARIRELLDAPGPGEPGALRGIQLQVVPMGPARSPQGLESPDAPGSSGAPDWYTSLERVPHTGLRQVELATRTLSGIRLLVFREAIVTDGDGGFRIEPFDVLTSDVTGGTGAETFLLIQRIRQGHTFRYRDFAIRDAGLFARNYEVEETGELVQVAGRVCRLILVTHADGERSFQLGVDLETGVILRDREFDASGMLVRSVEYVDFDPAPVLGSARTRTTSSEEIQTVGEIANRFEGREWRPRTTPARHFLSSISLVGSSGSDADAPWIKWTYSDGVKSLFFLHRPAPFVSGASGASGSSGASALAPTAENTRVRLFEAGALRAVHGVRGEDEFFAVGDISEAELMDLINSALP